MLINVINKIRRKNEIGNHRYRVIIVINKGNKLEEIEKMKKIILASITMAALAFCLSSCTDNSAQKKGEKIDHSYRNAKANVKNTFTKGPAEKAGQRLDKATKKD